MKPSADAAVSSRRPHFNRAMMVRICFALLLLAILTVSSAHSETVSIAVPADAAPRVQFGAEMLLKALTNSGATAAITPQSGAGRKILLGHEDGLKAESFS